MSALDSFSILDTVEQGLAPKKVNITEFSESSAFCNKPLYPRQTVLLKLIFLEEMTGEEEDVLTHWIEGGRNGNEITISPNIRERRDFLREAGYSHFREACLVGGRRSSKGFVTGLAMAKVMYDTLQLGDPGAHYGIDPTKDIYFSCVAGSESQAKEYQYADLVSTIETCKAFEPYLQKSLETEFHVATESDLRKMNANRARGAKGLMRSIAKIRGKALAANAGTLRGSATMCIAIDEMAHMIPGESKASADQVYCLDPDTKVLVADLQWRPIKNLRVGDPLISVDEYAPAKKAGNNRKMRYATVKGIKYSRSAPVKVTFDDSTSVTCSDNHRWLTGTAKGWQWVYAGTPPKLGKNGHELRSLRIGDRIKHIVDPWQTDQTHDGGWLAGILDGEGHISSNKRGFVVAIAQNAGLVYDRVLRVLSETGLEYREIIRKDKDCRYIEIVGLADCLRVLGQYRPVRLLEKSRQLWEDKQPRMRPGQGFKTVVGLERLPVQDLIDIETSEATFIAEGLISHNTAADPSLDQFGLDGLMFLNSSPYTKVGMFYECYENALKPFDPTAPVTFSSSFSSDEEDAPGSGNGNPRNFVFQYPSWALFEGYRYYKSRFKQKERGKEFGKMITVSPDWNPDEVDAQGRPSFTEPDKAAIIQARAKEASNPETYKVERRGKFAEITDSYLNPSMVDQMYRGVPDGFDQMPNGDVLRRFRPLPTNTGIGASNLHRYKFHIDPSSTTAGFGFAIAHNEFIPDPITGEENAHVVFDLIKRWDPTHFAGKVIRWKPILEEIFTYATIFMPFEITFDQHQSAEPIQQLQEMLQNRNIQCRVYEAFATNELNWKRWEVFKTALYQNLVHAPYDEARNASPMGTGSFTSQDELKFLQRIATGGKYDRVEKQDIGPVQTKDMADCIAICTHTLIGNLYMTSMRERLSESSLAGGSPGGYGIGQGGPVGGNGPPGISGYYSSREEKALGRFGESRASLTRGALGARRGQRGFRSRGR